MATFEAQVEGLTGLSVDGSSAPTQTELTQFLTDGAKEVINLLPPGLLPLCASQATFTSTAAGSESEILNTGNILNVFRNDGDIDQPCRRISADDKGRVSDPYEMSYAKISDPVYYVENNKINALPDGGSCKYSEVQYPTVAYGDSAIGATSLSGVTATAADPTVFTKSSHGLSTGDIVKLSNFNEMTEVNGMTGTVTKLDANTFEVNGVAADPAETTGGNVVKLGGFPDEVEYLVPLYASIKALQRKMADKTSSLPSDIPLPPIPNAPSAPSFDTGAISVSSSVPTYIKPAFDKVGKYIEQQEDTELAQAKLQEINSQIQDSLNQFNKEQTVFQNELQEKIQEADNQQTKDSADYSAKLQKYSNQIQIYTSEVNSKVQDFNTKLQKHNIDYQWLQAQHKQLIDDYNRGLQILTGGK